MNIQHVERGIGILKNFADQRGLGSPNKVLLADPHPRLVGVGCEWPCGARTAVALSKELSEEANEIERRVRDWKDCA